MTSNSSHVLYSERTLPSLLFYLALLTLPLSLFLVALPFSELVSIALALISIPVAFWLTWISSPLILITTSELKVGKTSIERKHLGATEIIKSDQAFTERGINLDSRAFTRFQIGITQLVKIQLLDDLDPTPYWLIATRNPEVVAAILNKR